MVVMEGENGDRINGGEECSVEMSPLWGGKGRPVLHTCHQVAPLAQYSWVVSNFTPGSPV